MSVLEQKRMDVLNRPPHQILKQAPPFLFIDRVIRLEGSTIECVKNVAYNEPYFAGHFPGEPIVPGVLMIEMAAQASMLLSIALEDLDKAEARIGYLVRTQDFRFINPSRPGDTLHIIVEMKEKLGNYHTTKVRIINGSTQAKVAKGELIFFLPEG
ncbi:3-hydroxyacyl-ACP dehydratase FabZ family protein [Paenibacillus sp. P36]|uniref:3-hydroxyacyl-ACP dehydratase FabZ family protein n=1 Tax=Paenibacillus sp. P36 TaxID=3342538 RepID=UPI0038B3DA0F